MLCAEHTVQFSASEVIKTPQLETALMDLGMDVSSRPSFRSAVTWLTECSCSIADVPYDLAPKFLDELLTKHRIDYVIHGDDPCILPGEQ